MQFFLTLYFFILPFQWALSPTDGVDLALSRLLAIILVSIWAVKSLAERRVILPSPRVAFFVSGFLFVATLSLFWAENHGWSARKIIFLWNFFPLFLVIAAALEDQFFRKKIIEALVGGAAIASLVGILQFSLQFFVGIDQAVAFWAKQVAPFFLGSAFGATVATYSSLLVNISGATVMRATAFFPDPHMFALYLGLVIPLAAGLWAQSQDGCYRKKALAAIGVLIVADLLTFSRGGYLGLGAGLVMTALVFFNQALTKERRRRVFLGGAILAILLSASLFTPFGARFASSFSLGDGSNHERLRLWRVTIDYIAERPLLGVGLGNYPLLVKPSADYREPIYAHSLFLDIAAETGLVGMGFFLGILGVSFAAAWRRWRRKRDFLALAACIALVIFSTHSLFELPLFSVQVLPVFLLLLALAGV